MINMIPMKIKLDDTNNPNFDYDTYLNNDGVKLVYSNYTNEIYYHDFPRKEIIGAIISYDSNSKYANLMIGVRFAFIKSYDYNIKFEFKNNVPIEIILIKK